MEATASYMVPPHGTNSVGPHHSPNAELPRPFPMKLIVNLVAHIWWTTKKSSPKSPKCATELWHYRTYLLISYTPSAENQNHQTLIIFSSDAPRSPWFVGWRKKRILNHHCFKVTKSSNSKWKLKNIRFKRGSTGEWFCAAISSQNGFFSRPNESNDGMRGSNTSSPLIHFFFPKWMVWYGLRS